VIDRVEIVPVDLRGALEAAERWVINVTPLGRKAFRGRARHGGLRTSVPTCQVILLPRIQKPGKRKVKLDVEVGMARPRTMTKGGWVPGYVGESFGGKSTHCRSCKP
jgi:hypothetical protein